MRLQFNDIANSKCVKEILPEAGNKVNFDMMQFLCIFFLRNLLKPVKEFQFADFKTIYITINFLGVVAYLVSLFLLQ